MSQVFVLYFFAADVKKKESKNLLDMIRVPGIVIMILICTMGRYTINGMAAMIGDWVVITVGIQYPICILLLVLQLYVPNQQEKTVVDKFIRLKLCINIRVF